MNPESGVPHILVVDDDPAMRSLITDYLTANDFRASGAENSKQMACVLDEHAIQLIILDLRIPGDDGMQIARKLRDQSAIPIIVVSGRRDEADRVMALELGADDYITKPFSLREMLARIRTVLRRASSITAAPARSPERYIFFFNGWELNMASHTLVSPTKDRVELTNGELSLLHAFLLHPGQILTRARLLEASRTYDDVYDRSIDVQILRLRRKIEKDPSQPEIIRTQRGAGYVFSCVVEKSHIVSVAWRGLY